MPIAKEVAMFAHSSMQTDVNADASWLDELLTGCLLTYQSALHQFRQTCQ